MKQNIPLDDRQLDTISFLVDLGTESLIRSPVLRKRVGISLTDIASVRKALKIRHK